MIIIPIGIQCTTAGFKNKIQDLASLPFDSMFATPVFVFEIFVLLLEKNMNICELVKEHFFCCEKRANMKNKEHYYTCDNGFALYNTKYDVIFPHDKNNVEDINKYIRRFERLKDIIYNSKEEIYFIYASPPSLEDNYFTIDGKHVVTNVYKNLSNIYKLVGKYRNNYKMVLFDSIQNEERTSLNENIIVCNLTKYASSVNREIEMNNYIHLFT